MNVFSQYRATYLPSPPQPATGNVLPVSTYSEYLLAWKLPSWLSRFESLRSVWFTISSSLRTAAQRRRRAKHLRFPTGSIFHADGQQYHSARSVKLNQISQILKVQQHLLHLFCRRIAITTPELRRYSGARMTSIG